MTNPGRHEIRIEADGTTLPGTLTVPRDGIGVVAFAHGSGSSRLSPRNHQVAESLHAAGLATLLFDLLTPPEADYRANVFDIELLARRLLAATTWLRSGSGLAPSMPLGYFGASTGAAAALWAAAESPPEVGAVVSRGGRPDLAGPRAAEVRAPTLLILGGRDVQVLELNRQAMAGMTGHVELVVVPGASHLFEEPGALEQVAGLATSWFVRWLSPGDDEETMYGEA
jgi:putative phosphoribosyl transferase